MTEPVIALDCRLAGTRATGDATYWQGLLYGLARISRDATFLLYSNGPRPHDVPESDRFQWVELPGSSRFWSLVRFPLAARRAKASAIHTQYNLSPLTGKRGITTIHDVSFWIEPSWFGAKDRALLGRFVSGSARRAAAVLTVSESSRRDILRFLPGIAPKLTATLLGPPIDWLMPETDLAVERVKAEFALKQPFALTVGTRWPRKNMSLAIRAIDQSRHMDIRLALTGKKGWGDEALGKRTQTLGYVSRDQLKALYASASLFLAPSCYEGFGLTLLEAFASGCPVVCSAGGAHSEVGGNAARVMSSWEPGDWAREIDALIDDPSKLAAMREKGFERIKAFSWEKTAEQTLRVYQKVAQL